MVLMSFVSHAVVALALTMRCEGSDGGDVCRCAGWEK